MNEINSSVISIAKLIDTHRKNAFRKINEELVMMYYEIGSFLSKKIKEEKWGSKVIENIAQQINNSYPELKGFNKRGLYRMIQFYETYKDNEIVSPLVSQISWSNNIRFWKPIKLYKSFCSIPFSMSYCTIFRDIIQSGVNS